MSDKPGWLGRAQWMPIGVSDVTPAVQHVARATTAFAFVFAAVVLTAGWVVGHVTSSIGWGFVAMVAAMVLELPIVVLLVRRFQAALVTLPPSGLIVGVSSDREERVEDVN